MVRCCGRELALAAASILVVALAAGTARAAATTPPAGVCRSDGWCWEYPELPLLGARAVAGTGPSDVWLAYAELVPRGGRDLVVEAAIVHWDGVRWAQTYAGNREVVALWATRPGDAWAAARDGTVLHWDGVSWRELRAPAAASVAAIRARSGDDAWVLGSSGLVHCDASACGLVPTGFAVRSVWPAAKDDAWLVSAGVWHWNGRDATELKALPRDTIAIGGTGARDGWLATETGEVWRWDGIRWSPVRRESKDDAVDRLVAVSGSGTGSLRAVDRGGNVLTFDGRRWIRTPGASVPLGPSPPSMTASGDEVWIVGEGRVLHLDGRSFSEVPAVDPRGIGPAFAVAPDEVWAVGEKGLILRRVRGLWAPVPFPSAEDLGAVFGSAPDDVWVAGESIWHFDGKAWTRSLPDQRCSGLWGIGRDDVWAVGRKILHWDGKAWAAVMDLDRDPERCPWCPAEMSAVWGFSRTDVIAVGQTLEPPKSHEEGMVWWSWSSPSNTNLSVESDQALYSVWGRSRDDLWLGGSRTLERWVKGRKVAVGEEIWNVVSLWGRGRSEVWAVQSVPSGSERAAWRWDGRAWSKALDLFANVRLRSVTGTNVRVWISGNLVAPGKDGVPKPYRAFIVSRERARR